ncbi:ParB/RepB/Spo0J family partition protein [Cetobacterium sp. SF1]|uniref:ParB/RepB/Spo0J family partition protein n=1 Tax=Cetobacterium sp. SF1 TaxID=3417654 RepID=UPI003CE6BCEA
MDFSNNPLAKREKKFQETPKIDKNIIEKYGEVKNITYKFFEKIDVENRKFINRLDLIKDIENNENFLGLLNSIKEIGLINPIYLLEDENEKFIIISGWRRSLALKKIFETMPDKIYEDKAIILKKNTPEEILENISIDENTKRKDLSLLELSYKFNKLSEENNNSVEDILEKFNIGKSQYHAIKKAVNFETEIKEILDEIGVIKADILNKIYKEYKKKNQEINLNLFINKTRDELKDELKKIKTLKKEEKNFYSIKENKNNLILTIDRGVSKKTLDKILKLLKEKDAF